MIETVPAPRFTYDPIHGAPAAAKAAWEAAGCLILENFVAPEACDSLIAAADRLSDQLVEEAAGHAFDAVNNQHAGEDYFLSSGDVIRAFMEENAAEVDRKRAVNKLGHAMHDLDPDFEAFSHQQQLARLTGQLGLGMPQLLQSMLIFKHARVGGEVTMHQDSTFIYSEPESCIGFWFALQDATLENGAMYALPGWHKGALERRFFRTGDGAGTDFEHLSAVDWPLDEAVPLEAPRGSLILLHGRLPHRSSANTSDRSRYAYTLHTVDASAHYPADNWLQRREGLPLRTFGEGIASA